MGGTGNDRTTRRSFSELPDHGNLPGAGRTHAGASGSERVGPRNVASHTSKSDSSKGGNQLGARQTCANIRGSSGMHSPTASPIRGSAAVAPLLSGARLPRHPRLPWFQRSRRMAVSKTCSSIFHCPSIQPARASFERTTLGPTNACGLKRGNEDSKEGNSILRWKMARPMRPDNPSKHWIDDEALTREDATRRLWLRGHLLANQAVCSPTKTRNDRNISNNMAPSMRSTRKERKSQDTSGLHRCSNAPATTPLPSTA